MSPALFPLTGRGLRNALLIGGAVGAVALGVYADRTSKRPAVVDVLPRNTAIVADLDVTALRNSRFGREALESGPLRKAMDEVRKRCGVDPFVGVEHVGLAMPGGSGLGTDLAIVATGTGIRSREVVSCAEAMVRERGTEARVGKHGSFVTVQEGTGERGVLAVRDGGPIVISQSLWLDAILDVGDREASSLRGDAVHDERRRAQKDAFLVLTYALPAEERARLTPMLPKGAVALTAMPELVATLRADDHHVSFEILASCEPAACGALADWIKGARDILAHDPRVTILGIRPQLDAATIAAQEGRVQVRLEVPLAELDRIGAQLASSAPLPAPALPSGHPSVSAAASGRMDGPGHTGPP